MGLGVPLNTNFVKGRISNRKSLYTDVVLLEVAPAVPVLNSIHLALAIPIKLQLAEPLVSVTSSYN